ncbi:MAG: hypothetical protein JHC26_08555 [Thermofilum sp.]|uniref:hypothetical protein n=1 Tax=Thermofilum sp. TaxID=1961369 RepID=UPI002582EC0D|nr:hypothetical protein [Thermofilum sp.]MCI4409127.1 hypothetical protein [Thermofilum sp.]
MAVCFPHFDIVEWLSSHGEVIDEFCWAFSCLYKAYKNVKDFEIRRFIYKELQDYAYVLERLTSFTDLDKVDINVDDYRKFIKSDKPFPDNMIGNICRVFTKSFKLAVKFKDSKAREVMYGSLSLIHKTVSTHIDGLLFEDLQMSAEIKKELGDLKAKLDEIMKEYVK